MKQKLTSNYFIFLAYQFLVLLVPMISMPYVSRTLGPNTAGTFDFLQSVVFYFVLLASSGSAVYGQREIAYMQTPEDRTKMFVEILLVRFLMTFLCLAAFLGMFGVTGEFSVLYRLFIFDILTVAFDISWFYQGMEEFKRVVLQCTIIRLVALFCIFIFVKSPQDLPKYILCQSVPNLLGALSLWPGVHKRLTKIPWRKLRLGVHMLPILLLFLPQIATEVFAILDRTMLGIFTEDFTQNGYYMYAQKIVKIVLIGITSLGTVMIPSMSAALARNEKEEVLKRIKGVFQIVFWIGSPLMFGLIAVSDVFIPMFLGEKYLPSIQLVWLLAPTILLVGFSNVMGVQYLLPSRQQFSYTLTLVGGIIVNVIGNALLIRHIGAAGTVIATVAAEFMVTFTQSLVVRKQLPIKQMYLSGLPYVFYGAVMGAVAWAVGRLIPNQALSFVIRCGVAVVVYLLIMLLVRDQMTMKAKDMIQKKLHKG